MTTEKKLINHVIFAIDSSSSMSHLSRAVVEVFEKTVDSISKTSENMNQDTYISVYTFASRGENKRLHYCASVADIKRKGLSYTPYGMTAMRDSIEIAIKDHSHFNKIEAEDHTSLVYVITDGADNHSSIPPSTISRLISDNSEHFTIACLVPNITGVHEAKLSGIPAGNIVVWDVTSAAGVEEMGETITASYQTYATNRSVGMKSTSSIFQTNLNVSKTDIKNAGLVEVKGTLHHAQKDYVIKDFAEKVTGAPYQKGKVFYELSKTELVQGHKDIVIVHKGSELKRYGGNQARQLLGIGQYDMKVKPGSHGDWRIFIQSTSLNRKILAGTSIFIAQ